MNTYFRDEIQKQAGAVQKFGNVLRLAGKHPKITIGTIGGLAIASQIPRIANKALGLYLMTSEPKKRKIMKAQMDLLEQIKNNTSDKPIKVDPRRIPIKRDLI